MILETIGAIGWIMIAGGLLGIIYNLIHGTDDAPRQSTRHAPSQYLMTDQEWADGPLRGERT